MRPDGNNALKCPNCGTKIIVDLKEFRISQEDIAMLREFFESDYLKSV